MYPEVQLPSPNGSLGHTQGQVNCVMARSKALINAVMPVYFFGTNSRTSQMARPNPLDLTVCPTPDPVAFPLTIVPKLYSMFEAVPGPGTCRWSSDFYRRLVISLAVCRSRSAEEAWEPWIGVPNKEMTPPDGEDGKLISQDELLRHEAHSLSPQF